MVTAQLLYKHISFFLGNNYLAAMDQEVYILLPNAERVGNEW